jgi:hypothetical protein
LCEWQLLSAQQRQWQLALQQLQLLLRLGQLQ